MELVCVHCFSGKHLSLVRISKYCLFPHFFSSERFVYLNKTGGSEILKPTGPSKNVKMVISSCCFIGLRTYLS